MIRSPDAIDRATREINEPRSAVEFLNPLAGDRSAVPDAVAPRHGERSFSPGQYHDVGTSFSQVCRQRHAKKPTSTSDYNSIPVHLLRPPGKETANGVAC